MANFGIVVKIVFNTLQRVQRTVTYSLSFAWTLVKEAFQVWLATRPSLSNAFNKDFGLFYQHVNASSIDRGVGLGGIYVLNNDETYEYAKTIIRANTISGAGELMFKDSTFNQTIRSLAAARNHIRQHAFCVVNLLCLGRKLITFCNN